MALERYIAVFFDAFLVHTPCIHVATFKAESAHPSLLLAMAAVGANYHEEPETASNLHRAARLSILNIVWSQIQTFLAFTDLIKMEQTSFTSKSRPTWTMQSIFLTMFFGVWKGKFDAVQESLAFQSNLAHVCARSFQIQC